MEKYEMKIYKLINNKLNKFIFINKYSYINYKNRI